MNKETLEKIYKQIVTKEKLSNEHELMIATIGSRFQSSSMNLNAEEERDVLNRLSMDFSELILDGVAHASVDLLNTTGSKVVTASALYRYFTNVIGVDCLVDECLKAGIGVDVYDVAIAVSPAIAASSLIDMDDEADEDLEMNMKNYYIVIIQWKKDDIAYYDAINCNLYQYVQKGLVGTSK